MKILTLLNQLLQGGGTTRSAKAKKKIAAEVIDFTGATYQGATTEDIYLQMNEGQKRAFVMGTSDMLECLAKYLRSDSHERFGQILTYMRELDTESKRTRFDDYIRTHPEVGKVTGRAPGAASSFLSMLMDETTVQDRISN